MLFRTSIKNKYVFFNNMKFHISFAYCSRFLAVNDLLNILVGLLQLLVLLCMNGISNICSIQMTWFCSLQLRKFKPGTTGTEKSDLNLGSNFF